MLSPFALRSASLPSRLVCGLAGFWRRTSNALLMLATVSDRSSVLASHSMSQTIMRIPVLRAENEFKNQLQDAASNSSGKRCTRYLPIIRYMPDKSARSDTEQFQVGFRAWGLELGV